jgi:Transposase DDE domain
MEKGLFLEMWGEIKELFENIFKKYDDLWVERERKINTKFLVLFLFRLVIPKDERGYANTLLEIFNNFLNKDIQDMPKTLAASSVCEARMKLDPEIFRELNEGIIKIWNSYNKENALWHGFRLYGIDGSKFLLPKELLKEGFKKDGKHVHYPHGLLSSLYDLLTGIPYDYSFVNHGNERACALEHLKKGTEPALYVHDRGYFCFELLSTYVEKKNNALFRLQKKTRIKVIDDFWESNNTDEEVVVEPPKKLIQKVEKGFCKVRLDPIRVRLIKYTINDKTYVLLATLTDKEKYPESCFKDVYHSRWGHEEMLKVSKVITGVTDFHSRTKRGIEQELFAHFVIITLLKIIESQAHQQVEKKISDKKAVQKKLRRLTSSDTEKALKENASKNALEGKKEVQINQKGIFLLIGWALEKIVYEPVEFISSTINYIVESAEKTYQWFRPDRAYPRRSQSPPSKWWRVRKHAKA